ncbi:TIGR02391 family protein [Xanthobacter sp. KR7-65]|uniref:TIGR02391 family protein n=1 Tax=Xanthobacter sp. KR7-65 TaxID=3156612 RepID=UPI0032B51D4D
MHIADILPDADVIQALEPDELGLRMLPWLASLPAAECELGAALRQMDSAYGPRADDVKWAVREAWAWLEGAALLITSPQFVGHHDVRRLSRKAQRLAKEDQSGRVTVPRHLPKGPLHPSIREEVWALFHRAQFDTAVFVAMKGVEIAVREASGLKAELGIALMRRAFDKNAGPLRDVNAPEGEREARAHFFAGAIGSYKNPHSHRNVALDDPDEAAEIIMLANHLLRIVDGITPYRGDAG